MSKKSRRSETQPARRSPLVWLAVAGVLVLVVGGLLFWNLFSQDSEVAPQVEGGPQLVVDQTTIDEGYVKFNQLVRTTFRVSNVGDQPLKILGEPQVELVEGC